MEVFALNLLVTILVFINSIHNLYYSGKQNGTIRSHPVYPIYFAYIVLYYYTYLAGGLLTAMIL